MSLLPSSDPLPFGRFASLCYTRPCQTYIFQLGKATDLTDVPDQAESSTDKLAQMRLIPDLRHFNAWYNQLES